MKVNDLLTYTLKGEPHIQVVDHVTGKILYEWTQENVIVLDARKALIGAVSAPANANQVVQIKLGSDLGEIAQTGATTVTFAAGSPPTITRTQGSWITDLFVIGDKITIQGTASNNTTGTVTAVSATVLTLTTGNAIVNESSTTSQICRGTGTAPSAPTNLYNQNTMAATAFSGKILFTAPYILNIGSLNALQAVFNVTIIGSDVIAAQTGNPVSVNMSSAALHTGNGNVFAYARFPQTSISALVDINISWTISWQ